MAGFILYILYICTKRQYSKVKLSFQEDSPLLFFIMTEFADPIKAGAPLYGTL